MRATPVINPIRAACCGFLALTFLLCCAWGATGHKVVAQVAYNHLMPYNLPEYAKASAGKRLHQGCPR